MPAINFPLRPLTSADIPSVLEVQAAAPEIAQWTPADYARVAQGAMAGWVAQEEDSVAGFLIARRVASDLEILNFAVRASARRRGIGTALFLQALDWAKSFAAEKAFLEVRASNQSAIDFYLRQHFRISGRRPRYYANPPEDALLLTARI
ncbi:MAG: ribosomal protein S18-alanine N-acetyltransferase [Candidatus Acidiferrales bacterium]